MLSTMKTKKIQRCDTLLLVSSGCSPSSCSLELASLGPDEGLGIRVGNTRSSEMSDSLTCLSWSLEKQSVLASWCSQGKLIKSDDLTSSFQDPLTGLLGDLKSTKGHLRDVEDSEIVGDGSNNNSDLVSVSILQVAGKTGD